MPERGPQTLEQRVTCCHTLRISAYAQVLQLNGNGVGHCDVLDQHNSVEEGDRPVHIAASFPRQWAVPMANELLDIVRESNFVLVAIEENSTRLFKLA